MATPLTQADLDILREKIHDDVREEMSKLHTSLDQYLKKTEDWHTEFRLLRHSHTRLQGLLIKKGVISDDDLAAA